MCNCFEETLGRMKEHLKDKIPENAQDLNIDWENRAFMMAKGKYAPTSPRIEIEYRPTKKDGTPAKSMKRDSVTILASHCCYCGEKYERPEANAN